MTEPEAVTKAREAMARPLIHDGCASHLRATLAHLDAATANATARESKLRRTTDLLRETERERDELRAQLATASDAGLTAVIRDADQLLTLALRAAEIEAYPGNGWRESVRRWRVAVAGLIAAEPA